MTHIPDGHTTNFASLNENKQKKKKGIMVS